MAISTSIKNFATPHKTNGGGGGGNTYVTNAGNHLIVGSTNAYDTTSTNGLIYNIRGDKLTYNDGKFVNLEATNGNVQNIVGDTLSYNTGAITDLTSDKIMSRAIGSSENPVKELYAVKAEIEQLLSKNITTDYLTVTKSAHFFELIIDKIKSVGGSIILSATNCTLDYATAIRSGGNVTAYDVYWKAEEASGRELSNDWIVDDQAICQSFNNVNQGTSYNISNKYYWRLVTAINNDTYMWIGNENDPRNGTTETLDNSTYNTVNFSSIQLKMTATQRAEGWTVTPQQGVTWAPDTSAPVGHTQGAMKTVNTIYGIELTPTPNICTYVPQGLLISCSNARIDTTIYFMDGTSLHIPADVLPKTTYDKNFLNQTQWNEKQSLGTLTDDDILYECDSPIKKIILTNADEVLWTKVHSIRLGNDNTYYQTDPQVDVSNPATAPTYPVEPYTSAPGRGDNLVQLGYRYHKHGGQDKERASAIMISAYQTPDTDITPPSYAHYMDIFDFRLRNHRQTYFDATKAHFIGDFYVDANNTIQMNVYDTINNRTGIDIEQGSITLDAANTYINGNLTLTSDDQGFTVKGPNGMTVMTPESLGTYASFITANNINDDRDVTAYSITTTSNDRYETSFTYDYCIGYMNTNSIITIKNQSLAYQYGRIDGSLATVTTSYGNSVTYQAYYDDGYGHISSTTASTSITGNGTSVTDVGTLRITSQPGKIWIRARWSPSFAISSFTNYDGLGIRTNLKYRATYPVDGVYTKIASDGIGINMNGSKYIYMGNDGVYIDYGSKGGLHINSNKIEKRDPNGTTDSNGNPLWVTMSTLTTKRLGGQMTSYNILDSDEAIFIDDSENASGYTCKIILPIPIDRNISSTGGWKGRMIYIKNYSNATVKVECYSGSYGYIRASGDGTAMPDQTIGKNSRTYICDGMNWLEYNANG